MYVHDMYFFVNLRSASKVSESLNFKRYLRKSKESKQTTRNFLKTEILYDVYTYNLVGR